MLKSAGTKISAIQYVVKIRKNRYIETDMTFDPTYSRIRGERFVARASISRFALRAARSVQRMIEIG
jgi:hypothetical protein